MIRLLKKFFALFGLGVYRLQPPPSGGTEPWLDIANPVEFNAVDNLNALLSNEEHVRQYHLAEYQFQYARDLIELTLAAGLTGLDDMDIADAGCGTGNLLCELHKRFPNARLTGFEYATAGIAVARGLVPSARFVELNILEGTDEQFDLVYCIQVIEHLLYPDKAFQNLLRMVRPGGTLVLAVPNGRKDTFRGHINFWSPESWKVFLETQCGGRNAVVRTSELGDDLHAVIRLPG
jgi:2-polyprenyl-3-methyl-5-hydroxy-6-metoxy-1,4-benzoquinol methylase